MRHYRKGNDFELKKDMALKQQLYPPLKIFSCGDCAVFSINVDAGFKGEAFLRTNLGRADIRRREIIARTEHDAAILDRDWHDLPMRQAKEGFSLTLPLLEIGLFEAKPWLLPHDDEKPLWPEGDNFRFKVEPSENICGNTVYSVFVRQFGPNIKAAMSTPTSAGELEKQGYTVIPPSGTFRDVIRHLDFIVNELNSRIIQLLPIHPTPTVYGKMGSFGSPFAPLDYFAVDPALAEFDRKTTPLEQFTELVDAVHARNARLILDIPVNHTGWASRLHLERPDWFVRDNHKGFVSPGAWGVVWEDLCQLDYSRTEVHKFMASVFLHWCRLGVNGFRCDAGYMLPSVAWEYIVARVHREYPHTIFLLEGLGGPLDVQEKLLENCGLNWAYSELFQNYTREEIKHYSHYACQVSLEKGMLVNFAETHDNNRLAAKSVRYARMRTALCALLTHNGAFGITNGVEWFATEKVDVHGATSLNWDSPENQIAEIRRVQILLETHPAFFAGATLEFISTDKKSLLVVKRISLDGLRQLLLVINLDDQQGATAFWPQEAFPVTEKKIYDLLSGKTVELLSDDPRAGIKLEPGEVFCFSSRNHDLAQLEEALASPVAEPLPVASQRLLAAALEIIVACHGFGDISDKITRFPTEKLSRDPELFCSTVAGLSPAPLMVWRDGVDQRRTVMLPPDDFLLVKSAFPFRAEIKNNKITEQEKVSLALPDGGAFCVFTGFVTPASHRENRRLVLTVFEKEQVRHTEGVLTLLPPADEVSFRGAFVQSELKKHESYALCANNLGGMSQMRAAWGQIKSKYDAVLAANCHSDYPVDRHVMFTRLRGWLTCRGYFQELNLSCLDRFVAGSANRARWEFKVPSGQGAITPLTVTLEMAENSNAVRLTFRRQKPENGSTPRLRDDIPVRIVLRPDLEDRCNHEVTKAFTGPEAKFSKALRCCHDGFDFAPASERCLKLHLPESNFVMEPEWEYMVNLPVEEERGLEAHTDLFSPGYFEFTLCDGDERQLSAVVESSAAKNDSPLVWPTGVVAEAYAPESAMRHAMQRFIVRRDRFHTVIAGYPWFLDWGRDSLICLRGMIAAGYIKESREIILQFARFEQQGTLPNMIRGNDDSNRDTSDAPLWLFTAVKEFCDTAGEQTILDEDCGGRKLSDVLKSIAKHYINGTPNGIRMDADSGLIFSPAHFTWMDTNYPACTPREGYPIEIQVLWFAALDVLSARGDKSALELKSRVAESIVTLFKLKHQRYLADCLSGAAGTPARDAKPDDACRPNQLFAVTLSAVTDAALIADVLSACAGLLVPGGLRTLADSEVTLPLPIRHQGKLLNNPVKPYRGQYSGDEDTRRKPAYHNGTAWPWLLPSFCEALAMSGDERNRNRAFAILLSVCPLFESGAIGQFPEILDGNYPHSAKGCGAQAWSVTEPYRVYHLLKRFAARLP